MFSFFHKSQAKYDKLFYDFHINDINGKKINFSIYRNKTILMVNVASKCGFTKQYTSLQKLFEQYKNQGLVIIGVPSNQFGGQEPGSNKEIKNFCEKNFNITFIITDKVDVKGKNAHPVYLWAKAYYGSGAIPKWNFHKILINKKGEIHKTYSSFIDPMSKTITNEIKKI